MKITVDTNVLISAAFWYGDSHKIIELVEKEKVALILSPQILKEFAGVLQYEDIQEKILKNNLVMKHTVLKIAQLATIVEPSRKVKVIEHDPDDDSILECAIEGKVDYIVSQDKHLLGLKEYEGIRIVAPKEFVVIASTL